MPQVTPAGKIWLLKNIPFDKKYNHTKYFANSSAQHSWICSTSNPDHVIGAVKEGQNQIKDPLHGTIKAQAHQENLMSCNYLCWKNTSVDNATQGQTLDFNNYAFVDDIRFVSSAVVEIDYTIDAIQTYLMQGKCAVGKSFIDRTHTQSDAVGDHIEPEPVSYGDYKFNKLSSLFADPSLIYLVFSGIDLDNLPTPSLMGDYQVMFPSRKGGMLQGCYVYAFETDVALSNKIGGLRTDLAEAIMAVISVPKMFVQYSNNLVSNVAAIQHDNATGRYTNIDGITPKNNKLFTFPFNMLEISNLEGTSKDYRWEYFSDVDNIKFNMTMSMTPDAEVIAYPKNYEGVTDDYDARVTMSDFPRTMYMSSYFAQWMQDKGLSSILNGIMGAAGGAILGGMPGAIMGGITGGISTGNEFTKAQCHPNGMHGSTQGNTALTSMGVKNFYAYQKCLCKEDAKRIDNFFTRYGYALNTTGTVHFTNPRFNQHYVKTQNCVVTGGASSLAIEAIREAFDKGITIWKNDVGNYTDLWNLD